jgi:23S rRNA pseudouridine2605 synthase
MLERLQKIIARAGIASRRHAEELIVSGQVTVNGVVVTELGAKADPEKDRVEAAGRAADQPSAATYYILHKPPLVVSTMSDPEGRATLRHVLRGLAGGVFPVGRLDYAASGLIFLTSDGKLADSIFKVSSNLVKVFWMKVKGRPAHETLSKVGHKAQARLRLLRAPGASAGHVENPWYEAELRGAQRDLLRQAFFAAGHPVEKMKRVRFGPLNLGDLPEGHYRQLTPSEVEQLRRAVERAADQGSAPAAPAAAAPVVVRPFERKKWRAGAAAAKVPARHGDGQGDRGIFPRPPQDRFSPPQAGAGRPAARSGPARPAGPSRPGQRLFPPAADKRTPPGIRPGDRSGPRGARGTGSAGQRGAGPRSGRGKFAGKPGAPVGGAHRPGQPFHRGDGGKPRSEDRGSWRGERRGQPRGERPTGQWRGDRPSGPPRGDRPFRPGGNRGGDRGTGPRFGRDKFAGKPGEPGGGQRRPGQPFHRGDGGKPRGAWRGDRPGGPPRGDRKGGSGKFVPRGPRAGAPSPGKYRGKPARRGEPAHHGGRPPDRPPRRPDLPPEEKTS